MKRSWNRRQFLVSSGVAASAAFAGKSLLRPLGARAATFTRMDVGGLTATSSQIVSYAKAVTAMQALPASDPRSWSYQAAIHGTLAPCPCGISWNTCEHGTEFFWSWHRMYLYYFERIVRRYSGDYGWALPYWNWQLASENQLPSMFRNTSSSLYTVNRDPGINAGTSTLPAWATDCSTALGDLPFTSAVEDIQGPHGNVHVTVGGWMASVPTSAQDPIFYFHHSNVDRLWDIWLAQGGGRSDPVSDATWKGKTYTFFDENAKQVTMTDCDVLRAAQQLNYVYQGEPPQVNESCTFVIKWPPWWLLRLTVILQLPGPPVEVNSVPVSVPVELGDKVKQISAVAANPNLKLFVVLDNIEAATQPDVLYQVYVGLPAGVAADPKSPYYVGTFSLFGMGLRDEKTHAFMPARFQLNAKTAVATALRAKGNLSVAIVPVNPRTVPGEVTRAAAKSTLTIGTISFVQGQLTEQQTPPTSAPPTPSPTPQ